MMHINSVVPGMTMLLLLLSLMACDQSTKTAEPVKSLTIEQVIRQLQSSKLSKAEKSNLLDAQITTNFEQDLEVKNVSLIYNLLYHFKSDPNFKLVKQHIITSMNKHKARMPKYIALLNASYAFAEGNDGFANKLIVGKSPVVLIDNQKEIMTTSDRKKLIVPEVIKYLEWVQTYYLMSNASDVASEEVFNAIEFAKELPSYQIKVIYLYDLLLEMHPADNIGKRALLGKAKYLDRNLKKGDSALKFYRSFVDNYPDDVETATIKKRIQQLELEKK